MRALLLLFVAGTVTAQTTWIVDSGSPTAMPTLAAAVAAAADGDTIVIRHAIEGIAGQILLTKSLHIIGKTATGGAPTLWFANGGLDIQIAAGKELVFANCLLRMFTWTVPAAVNISNSAGRVVLQDLTGRFRLTIYQSQQVLLSRLDIETESGTAITASVVALDRCTLRGRTGFQDYGLQSAQAMLLDSSTVHGMNTTLRGGDPAFGKSGPSPSFPAMRALTAVSSSLTLSGAGSNVLSGVTYVGPPINASGSSFVFHPGLQPAIGGTGNTVTTRFLPTVSANGFVSGGNASLIVASPPGAPTALLFGVPGDRLTIPGVSGDLWIDPQDYCIPAVGVGGASWAVTVPPSPVLFGKAYRWQGLVLSQGLELGAPGSALLR